MCSSDLMIYKVIDKHGIEKIFEKIDEEYNKSEKIIPTKFAKFENKMSDEYRKIKNNFYMLWEAAKNIKKKFFNKEAALRHIMVIAIKKPPQDFSGGELVYAGVVVSSDYFRRMLAAFRNFFGGNIRNDRDRKSVV